MLENLVLNAIHQALQEKIDDVVTRLMQTQNKMSNGNSVIMVLQKEKRQVENSLNNIMQAVENGLMNNTTNKRMRDLEQQIEDLEKRILLEQSKTQIKLSADEIKRYYLDALKLMPQQLINCLIKQIELNDDKIKITFNTPIKGSDNTQGSFSCQDIYVTYMTLDKQINKVKFSILLYI